MSYEYEHVTLCYHKRLLLSVLGAWLNQKHLVGNDVSCMLEPPSTFPLSVLLRNLPVLLFPDKPSRAKSHLLLLKKK
jgi:hypothetical protein